MILDVGCGHVVNQTPRGHVNVDVEKPEKKIANFVRADAHYLPFRRSCFCEVIFREVIEHVQNPSRCLREIHRVLNSNGTVEISTPNPYHWRNILHVVRGFPVRTDNPDHIALWAKEEMCNLLWRNGFLPLTVGYLPAKTIHGKRRTILDSIAYRVLPKIVGSLNMIATARMIHK